MRKEYYFGAIVLLVLGPAAMFLISGSATGSAAHTGLTWQGTQTCLACHETQAREMHGSSHYQWQGPAIHTVNGPDVQGKLMTALNSYCVSILGNWNACGTCHVGLGAQPDPTPAPTLAQLQNIDCLTCHQKDYKRKKVGGVFVPDTVNMTVTMDQAAQTVHKPERVNCLQCHAKGGGGDNNKRGDMALAHGTTADRNFDVHMSTTGANLACQQCHTTQNHRIAGRGSDLRQTDLDVKMNCSTSICHTNKTTTAGHATADVNRHVGRVACQTCHISAYARNATDTAATETTEVNRNWQVPEFNAPLNRYEPTITRGGDLKPAYRFWNGTSWNYSLKEPVWMDTATGAYATSRPEGAINDSLSKLYPFKYKKALQPVADSLAMLIALDTAVYFANGNYDAAVKAGLVNMGYPNTTPYRTAESDTFQLITHEVRPRGNALTCTQCHTATATQMNLKDLGYAMKGTQATTCTQCHGREDLPSYTSLHNRHVANEKYDCSWCHSFSRPERGLQKPAGSDTTLPAVTAFSVPGTASSLTVPISSFTATDNVAVTGYLVTETSTKPTAGAVGWSVVQPSIYTFASAGSKTLYGWARDGTGNVSNSRSAAVTITLSGADTQAPTVTAFSVPGTASSLTVPISTFTATDNVAVTGYLVTETSTKPTTGAAGWSAVKPTGYTFASAGSKTLYGWARDGAGNVSNSRSAGVNVTLSSGSPDISTRNYLDFEEVEVGERESKSLYVSNRGNTPLTVTKVEVVGTNASAFRMSVTSFTVSPSGSYRLNVSFGPEARISYRVTLRIHSNDPDTPIKEVVLTGTGNR